MNLPVKHKVWKNGVVVDYIHGYVCVDINVIIEDVNGGKWPMAYLTLIAPDGMIETIHESSLAVDQEAYNKPWRKYERRSRARKRLAQEAVPSGQYKRRVS